MRVAAAAWLEFAILATAKFIPEQLGVVVLVLIHVTENCFELVPMIMNSFVLRTHGVVVVEHKRAIVDGQIFVISIAVRNVASGGARHVGFDWNDPGGVVAPEPNLFHVMIGHPIACFEPVQYPDVIGKKVGLVFAARAFSWRHD